MRLRRGSGPFSLAHAFCKHRRVLSPRSFLGLLCPLRPLGVGKSTFHRRILRRPDHLLHLCPRKPQSPRIRAMGRRGNVYRFESHLRTHCRIRRQGAYPMPLPVIARARARRLPFFFVYEKKYPYLCAINFQGMISRRKTPKAVGRSCSSSSSASAGRISASAVSLENPIASDRLRVSTCGRFTFYMQTSKKIK